MFVRFAVATTVALGLAVALSTFAVDAHGASSRMRALPKGARASEPAMTRDQLRQCLAHEKRIDADKAEMMQRIALHEAEGAKIDKLASEIDALKTKVEDTSQAQVDAYNALVAKHKEWVSAFNVDVPEINRRVEAGKALIARFNSECADRMYYERDMDAIKAGN